MDDFSDAFSSLSGNPLYLNMIESSLIGFQVPRYRNKKLNHFGFLFRYRFIICIVYIFCIELCGEELTLITSRVLNSHFYHVTMEKTSFFMLFVWRKAKCSNHKKILVIWYFRNRDFSEVSFSPMYQWFSSTYLHIGATYKNILMLSCETNEYQNNLINFRLVLNL